MTDVLARQDRALTPEETEALLRDRLGEHIVSANVDYATFTVWVAPAGWHAAAQLCRDESLLDYDLFDCLLGVDAREDGFDVVTVLYSTSTGNRICLRTRCDGGRDAPVCPSIADVYRGADWMERETYDMFGIDFEGHPGLEPRILTVENFEGWPLRKDFHLAARVAKPWPGVKEPAELDGEGNVVERTPELGGAPGPYDLDKAMADQAKAVNASEQDADDEDSDDAEATQATATEGDGQEEPPPADIDQETYDQLIAEGKSERIARSKAKAAFIKKQRAGGGDGDTSGDEAADDGPSAAEKAEARRKEQAEARRRKAEERTADADADDQGADDEEGQA